MSNPTEAGSGAEREHRGELFDEWADDGAVPDVEDDGNEQYLEEGDGGGRAGASAAAVFVVGALWGAFVLGLVWFTAAMREDDPATADSGGSGSDVASLTQQEQEGQQPLARGTRLERCALAAERLDTSLQVAAPAMAQWEVHVGAMNQLVVGAITLKQATDFWESTRVAAERKIGRFQDSLRPVRRAGLDCPVAGRLGHASQKLRTCVLSVDARAGAVDAADTAIRTWAGHVAAMEMMRMGHLSPADATKEWLSSWKQGVREIEAYKGATREAQQAGGC
ncbi:hypothetical protein DDE18_16550 [Nocardioides gansuensis]|uniref:Uncharacterized protein n=1 Tax=Nocardioides gansuensis TaxID=2138300 RepID=A0A2T8F7C9_9ACTN|nr:hypothetical protein [Nocardioides gansuensis]PVG81613.1 hypothetical protein DDE18_16550 [Nocardioides gansuensis]